MARYRYGRFVNESKSICGNTPGKERILVGSPELSAFQSNLITKETLSILVESMAESKYGEFLNQIYKMKIINSPLQGCYLIKENVIDDNRGHFLETYNYNYLKEKINVDQFIQENESFSRKKLFRECIINKNHIHKIKL